MRYVLLAVLLALSPTVWSFGKNKVQYQHSDWKKIQSQHFDVYFTHESQSLAEHSADQLELMYQSLQSLLNHKLSKRIPVIIHRSHQHFVETNVIRMALPEAVGGFTEVFKNRIVLPFNGSWNEFDHVLQHELVHALMFDQFSGRGNGMSLARRMGSMPLWFKEGLAEYASLGWNKESEFYLIDAVSTGYIAPPQYNFGGFLAYKGGQSFIYYLVSQFGERVISELIQEVVRGYRFEDAFQKVTLASLEEVGELWIRELRRIYWPELGQRQYAKSFAKPLTQHEKDPSHFNLAPAISPDGQHLLYFSDKEDWEGLQLMDLQEDKDLGRILKSGSKSEHESLHPFNSGFSWAPDNQSFAFVSKQKGKDVIHIMDVKTRKIIEVIDPQLDMILNPSFNPADPQELVFSGAHQTQQDLYIYHRKTQVLSQLTQDRATQNTPRFSPDGGKIVYTSNLLQGSAIAQDQERLFLLNRQTLEFELLPPAEATSPTWAGSSEDLIYVSAQSGVSNLYHLHLPSGVSRPITNTLSATYTPTITSDGKTLVFALFERGGWDLYKMQNPLSQKLPPVLPKTHYLKTPAEQYFEPIQLQNLLSYKKDTIEVEKDSTFLFNSKRRYDAPQADSTTFKNIQSKDEQGRYIVTDYDPIWTLDQAQALAGAATNGSNVNFGGQAYLTFTDLMGDQEFSLMLYSAGGAIEDVNYGLLYQYLPYRWDLGVGTSRYVSYSVDSSQTQVPQGEMTYGESYMDSVSVDTLSLIIVNPEDPSDTSLVQTPSCLYHTGTKVDTVLTYETQNGQGYCSRFDRFRDSNLGFQLQATYPMSIFSRWGLHLNANRVIRERLKVKDGNLLVENQAPVQTLYQFNPAITHTFDNIRWGYVGPINGLRAQSSLEFYPEMSSNPTPYFVAQTDLRQYWRFFKKYTLALRLSGGSAWGSDEEEIPYRFLVGGDNFNLFYRLNKSNLTGRLIDRYQSSLDDHLRGFDYLDFAGRNKFVSNLDWRFPLINRLDFGWPLPLHFRDIQGVVFADYGGAWSSGDAWDQMGLGLGWGWRMNIGYFVLRYSKAWSIDHIGPVHHGSRSYWSLGANF